MMEHDDFYDECLNDFFGDVIYKRFEDKFNNLNPDDFHSNDERYESALRKLMYDLLKKEVYDVFNHRMPNFEGDAGKSALKYIDDLMNKTDYPKILANEILENDFDDFDDFENDLNEFAKGELDNFEDEYDSKEN